jgi:hypothetical protein
MIAEWTLIRFLWSLLSPFRAVARWIGGLFTAPARVSALENELSALKQNRAVSRYRKCPECGERDYRCEDRYRSRPDVFNGPRYFHEKWRCYSCNHFEATNIEEPD